MGTSAAEDSSPDGFVQQSRVERIVERLVIRFFRHLDDFEYERLVALLAEDAVWHRPGRDLSSVDAIRRALSVRGRSIIARHLVTNLLIEANSDNFAQATWYLTVFRHAGGDATVLPLLISPPTLVSVYQAEFIEHDQHWKFRDMSSSPTFTSDPPPQRQ